MGRMGDPMVLLWAVLWLGLVVLLVAGIVWALRPRHRPSENSRRDRFR